MRHQKDFESIVILTDNVTLEVEHEICNFYSHLKARSLNRINLKQIR